MNQCTRGMLAVAGKVIASWAITPVVQTYLNITQTTSFMKPIKELRKLEGRPKVTMFQKSQGKLSTGNGKHSITKFMLWCVIGTVVEVPLGTCAFQVWVPGSVPGLFWCIFASVYSRKAANDGSSIWITTIHVGDWPVFQVPGFGLI